MEKQERKKLVNELREKLATEKRLQESDGFGKTELYRQELLINPKYLSKEEKCQLLALKRFIELNPLLTDDEARETFTTDKKKFAFLIECDEKYKNFISLVRKQFGWFMLKIAEDRRSDEVLKRELP